MESSKVILIFFEAIPKMPAEFTGQCHLKNDLAAVAVDHVALNMKREHERQGGVSILNTQLNKIDTCYTDFKHFFP